MNLGTYKVNDALTQYLGKLDADYPGVVIENDKGFIVIQDGYIVFQGYSIQDVMEFIDIISRSLKTMATYPNRVDIKIE